MIFIYDVLVWTL